MAQSTDAVQQLDPLQNFRFRVMWDGRFVAGISRVSALRRTTEVVTHTEGGSPNQTRKSPGRTQYEAITLERGVTQDAEFEKWAGKVSGFGLEPAGAVEFRKDIVIEVYDEAGQLARSYKVYHCWVSEYQALPELDGGGNGVAIEQIKLEHEGWERV
jgi:phage tail-like protein